MILFKRRWVGLIAIGVGAGVASLMAVVPEPIAVVRETVKHIPYVSAAGKWFYEWKYENFRFPDIPRDARGDGAPASDIYLQYPMGLAEDAEGRVYVADRGHTIWRIDPDSRARIVAGTGNAGNSYENADAREADLGIPEGLCLDGQGRIYFADSRNNKVLRIDLDGSLVRVAGTGIRGNRGDGGPAGEARLNRPFDLAVDSSGRLFIADYGNNRVRVVLPDGTMQAYAGTGAFGYSGDGGAATDARLNEPYGLFLDHGERLIITDSGNHVLRRVDDAGIITTIAGTGVAGYSGDGGPASAATFNWPQGGTARADGTILVNDEHNYAVRVIDADGTVSTLIGLGKPQRVPDGSPISAATLVDPEAVFVRADGTVLISEGVMEALCETIAGSRGDRRVCAGLVRRLSPEGTIGTFAGHAAFANP